MPGGVDTVGTDRTRDLPDVTQLDVDPQLTPTGRLRRPIGVEWLAAAVLLLLGIRFLTGGVGLTGAALQTWGTLFVALNVQALPFLVFGVTISGVIAAWLPPEALARVLPTNRAGAVAVASGAGVLLPGCECGSVPISGRLVARGVQPAAALAFMLAAPAINPAGGDLAGDDGRGAVRGVAGDRDARGLVVAAARRDRHAPGTRTGPGAGP